MLLAVSLVAPTVGTTRKDLFYKDGIKRDVIRAMDDLWRPNQIEIDRYVGGALMLTISRRFIESSGEILNWVGISTRSPFSPDGREGYVVGIGTFFTGSAGAEPLYNLLSDGFYNYMRFINHYEPNHYKGFILSDMRLDRIKLTPDYLDNLSKSLTRDTLKPVEARKGYLVRPFSNSMASFQDVYAFAQSHGDYARIIVSADPDVFLRSSLKELQFEKTTENKKTDPLPQAKPPQTGSRAFASPASRRKTASKGPPQETFSSAAAATLIPVTEQMALNGIEALMTIAAEQSPEGALARSSLEKIRKRLDVAALPVDRFE